MSEFNIPIFQWNVLAATLAFPNFFKADAAHLAFANRLPLILKKLGDAISQRQLIALQEVDIPIFNAIMPVLRDAGYEWIRISFARVPEHLGMSVFSAYPKEKYRCKNSYELCVADTIKKPADVDPNDIAPPHPEFASRVRKSKSVYNLAAKQGQVLIGMHLEHIESETEFWFFNFHFPYVWWWVPMTTLFVDAVKRAMLVVSDGLPFILCSDTSMKKGFADRTFFETGVITDEMILPHKKWNPTSGASYQLKDSLCIEGAPTTRCRPADASSDLLDGEFFANIDGIFHYGFDKINGTVKSQISGSLDKPMPNETEPSDHVALVGTLTVTK